MADTIQLRAGNKASMPVLLDREIAYVRDEKALYVGTPTGNEKMGADLENAVASLESAMNTAIETFDGEMDIILGKTTALEGRATSLEGRATALESSTSTLDGRATALENRATALEARAAALEGRKAAAVAPLATDAQLAAVITTVNSLIASLKACGLMNE